MDEILASLLIILAYVLIMYVININNQSEHYANVAFTNYEQIPNLAKYPNSIANDFIFNYQYIFPRPAIGERECST